MLSRHGWLKIVLGLLVVLCQEVMPAETGQAVVQLVRDRYQLDTAQYTVEVVANQLKTRLVNTSDLNLRPLTQSAPIGPFTLIVEIKRDSALIERGQVRLRISKFADVLVCTDKIQRHDLLTESNVELKRFDITNLREQPVISLDELPGQRAKRNLRVGSILTAAAIEPIPTVEIGGEVTIVYSDEWGSITAPGEALESGLIGDRVRVKNRASGKVIMATVASGKTVQVNP
ncbi:MAG: flagellar basal body P-ring formation chaperone FlgA [Candidatus Zixiibacteriota bacterium]